MHFMLTMDQVRKLYEELVTFDPSLGNNKEAVLQVIEKMIAAKPVIVANPIWKESFAEKLADHIAKKKIAFVPQGSISQWLAKWSFSLATSLIAIVVVGAAYWWLHIDKQFQKNNNVKNANKTNQIAQVDTAISDSTTVTGNADTANMYMDAEWTIDTRAGISADVSYQNTSLALRNTQTMVALNQQTGWLPINPSAKILTEVDAKETVAIMTHTGEEYAPDTMNVATTLMTKESAENWAMWWGASSMAADSPAVKSVEAPSAKVASNNQQKMIALVIVDDKGVVIDTSLMDTLRAYALPATFIETNSDLVVKLKWLGYETRNNLNGVAYIDLSQNNLQRVAGSLKEKSAVLLHADEVTLHPELLKVFIEKMKAEGYVFVNLSVIQK